MSKQLFVDTEPVTVDSKQAVIALRMHHPLRMVPCDAWLKDERLWLPTSIQKATWRRRLSVFPLSAYRLTQKPRATTQMYTICIPNSAKLITVVKNILVTATGLDTSIHKSKWVIAYCQKCLDEKCFHHELHATQLNSFQNTFLVTAF